MGIVVVVVALFWGMIAAVSLCLFKSRNAREYE